MPVKLNSTGGGSVTLTTPSTASDFTATFPAATGNVVTTGSSAVVSQAMLASGVAGNGPAFSAYLGSNQTLSNGVNTKLNINVETFDTNSLYDTSLYRFTPNVAGYYFVTGRASIPSSTYTMVMIYKNSGVVKSGVQGELQNSPYGITVSGLVYLNGSTDFIELYAVQYAPGGGSATANSGEASCFFDAFMARAA
jgi:hypothetical protein